MYATRPVGRFARVFSPSLHPNLVIFLILLPDFGTDVLLSCQVDLLV
jgi:hypothetical protein